MFDFTATRICPLNESVIDEIVEAAGGKRAHPDHDRRLERNADYILGEAVIELKVLEDEGLGRNERHEKLAALFSELDPERPVYVLDRALLDQAGRRIYDRALEGPIKGAVKSAKAQLVQSRAEYPETKRSILFLVNNGNAALDHDEIVQLVERRARNDTKEIDGVVVAGAYLHSDGFDTFALWPIDYVPIRLDRPFPEYDTLRDAFNDYAGKAMADAIIAPSDAMTKGPTLDTGFDFEGKRFVNPAPPLGKSSDFYLNGRPRLNSTGIVTSPPVGLIFPELDRAEWTRFHDLLPQEPGLFDRYQDWLADREVAIGEGTSLKPLVTIPVTLDGWLASIDNIIPINPIRSVRNYANALFQEQITAVIDAARDIDKTTDLPSRFVLAVTELIGQDEANGVSHILLIEDGPQEEPNVTELVRNARIFHLYAGALGAAYAVAHGVSSLLWQKDRTYAWS